MRSTPVPFEEQLATLGPLGRITDFVRASARTGRRVCHDLNHAPTVDPIAARQAERARRRQDRAGCARPVSDTLGHETRDGVATARLIDRSSGGPHSRRAVRRRRDRWASGG
jgi:hypothetical protein